ncbi:MAG: para-aminobenzoate synthetase component 1 [Pseudohongiellaceae bacterium]|jgi:para-aminobenzoate synthetase component 1
MIKVTAIPYQANCEALFSLLRDLPFACWLDSGKPASEYGRYDIISALPAVRLVSANNQTTVFDCQSPSYDYLARGRYDDNPLDLIQSELKKLTKTRVAATKAMAIDDIAIEDIALDDTVAKTSINDDDRLEQTTSKHAFEDNDGSNACHDIPFSGGAIGYFAYDLHKHLKRSSNQHGNQDTALDSSSINQNLVEEFLDPTAASLSSNFDDMQVGIYHWAIIQDHQRQQAYITSLPECNPLTLEIIRGKLSGLANHAETSANTATIEVEPLAATLSKEQYSASLFAINEYILAGDSYQVNFAQRFQAKYKGDPYVAYRQLREAMASPFSAYLQLGDQAIMSLSPERFLQVVDNQVLTQPIKGTSRRDKNPEIDKHQGLALQNDEKNRAENLMIVDLLRNDIGQHCNPGSIDVETLFGLQSFPNVHHLVSDIVGTLKAESNSIDLLKDCFPGGSITGAPKKRAMEIIDELEHGSRGVYCGSIGYINSNGNMDTNIAIRTVSCDGELLTCWGGGGIVADSNADDEYQESLDKINRILNILSPKV